MKTKNLLLFFSVLFFCSSLFTQTLVNKYLLDPFGTPSTSIEWSAFTLDQNSHLITTGHTVLSPEEIAILTVHQDATGNINWQQTYTIPGTSVSKNYGIAVETDNNNNVYVLGASISGILEQFNFTILKYTPSGQLIWSSSYNHTANDIPTALAVDSTGDIFITGGSYNLNGNLDGLTLKLDGSNGAMIWERRYDLAGFDDAVVDVKLDSNGHPVTIGASQGDPDNWKFVSVKYHKNTGAALEENAFSAPPNSTSLQPIALQKDNTEHFYLAGNLNTGTENQSIQVLKLDANLNLIWSQTLGGMETAGVNSLRLSNDNQVLITGYRIHEGRQEMLVARYDSDGSLLWQRHRKPERDGYTVEGKRSVVDEAGNIYVAGAIDQGHKSALLLCKYDANGNLIWQKTHHSYAINGYEYASSIRLDAGKIYVSGIFKGADFNRYYTLYLEELERHTTLAYDETGIIPKYKKGNLIVKFNPAALRAERVDKLDVVFGSPAYFLTEAALAELETVINTSRVTMLRIFKQLKTTDTVSISRLAEEVHIPEFWSSFIFLFPEETDLANTMDLLGSTFPLVLYSHPNYVGTLLEPPTDEEYGWQSSLHPGVNIAYDSASIFIEQAWELEQGKPHIRTGVFDSPVDYRHRDFGFLSDNPSNSVVKAGWYFQDGGSDLFSYGSELFSNAHGTNVGGIIGAITNNNLGISPFFGDVAGIAGGWYDPNVPNEGRGTSLYSLGIFNPSFFVADLEYVLDAMVTSVIDDPDLLYGYGLHLMNHSWGISPYFNEYTEANIALLRDATHFAQRNHVTVLAGRGNGDPFSNIGNDSLLYPACYNDDWVLNVGGTGNNGNYKDAGNGDPNWSASYGNNIDIAAPAEAFNVRTLGPNNTVTQFGGTSAAAAHTTGLAALLLSYANSLNTNDYQNLAPEDVEYVLQKTATDRIVPPSYPGPDEHTGFGKIHAGKALYFIEKPIKEIRHYDSAVHPSTVTIELVESDLPLEVVEPYLSTTNFDQVPAIFYETPATYWVEVYEVNAIVTHDLEDFEVIEHAWERHSSSNPLKHYTAEGQLYPHEQVSLVSYDQETAHLRGYVYRLKEPDSDNIVKSLPYNFSDPTKPLKLAYSLLIKNELIDSDQTITEEKLAIQLFPNPAQELIYLQIDPTENQLLQVECYNILGQRVFHDPSPNASILSYDIRSLAAGTYFLRVQFLQGEQHVPFIKS